MARTAARYGSSQRFVERSGARKRGVEAAPAPNPGAARTASLESAALYRRTFFRRRSGQRCLLPERPLLSSSSRSRLRLVYRNSIGDCRYQRISIGSGAEVEGCGLPFWRRRFSVQRLLDRQRRLHHGYCRRGVAAAAVGDHRARDPEAGREGYSRVPPYPVRRGRRRFGRAGHSGRSPRISLLYVARGGDLCGGAAARGVAENSGSGRKRVRREIGG